MDGIHWLAKSPRQILDVHNSNGSIKRQTTSRAAEYNSLTIKVFVLHKDDVLLQREAALWAVPTLQYRAGSSAQRDDDVAILHRIVEHLDHINIPASLLHELQFMEFSHPAPRIVTTRPSNSCGLTILVVLTTSYPALGQGVAASDQPAVPEHLDFRWIDKTKLHSITQHMLARGISLNLSPMEVQYACARLNACARSSVLPLTHRSHLPRLCCWVVWAIVATRAIVKRNDEEYRTPTSCGFGELGVSQDPEKRFIVLIYATRQEYDEAPYRTKIYHGNHEVLIIARWENDAFEGLHDFDHWGSLFDVSGRLRENIGSDED